MAAVETKRRDVLLAPLPHRFSGDRKLSKLPWFAVFDHSHLEFSSAPVIRENVTQPATLGIAEEHPRLGDFIPQVSDRKTVQY